MRNIECESCGHTQSQTWKTGDLCGECGGSVRAEVACAWCCHYVPAQKFCRDCGFEMVALEHFGVARMLKSSQIDKLSLPGKIREMAPDHIEHFRALFNRDYALLDTRMEEMRLAESLLLHKTYSFTFQADMLEKLPFDDEVKAFLKKGPTGAFENRPLRLAEVAQFSPIGQTRWLAMLAMARQPQHEHEFYGKVYLKLKDAFLSGEDTDVKSEALAGLSYWKMLPHVTMDRGHGGEGFTSSELAKHTRSTGPFIWDDLIPWQKPYVAPILHLVGGFDERLSQEIEQTLEASQFHTNKDLSLSAQIAMRSGTALYDRVRGASAEPNDRQYIANYFLALFQLPQCYEVLSGDHNVMRDDMLGSLLSPAGAQLNSFSDSILRGFLAIVNDVVYPHFKSKIYEILAKSPYAAKAVEKAVASTTMDLPAALKSLRANPDQARTVLDALAQEPLTDEIIVCISDSLKGYPLGRFWVSKLWVYALAQTPKTQHYFVLPNLIRNILSKENEDTKFLLKLMLKDMMAEPTCLQLIYDSGSGEFAPTYRSDDGGTQTFAPMPLQLSALVYDQAQYLDSVSEGIGALDPDHARRFFQRLWVPHQESWIDSLISYPQGSEGFVEAFKTLLMRPDMGEYIRVKSLKALLALAPIMPQAQRAKLQELAAGIPAPEGGMHYLIERLGQIG